MRVLGRLHGSDSARKNICHPEKKIGEHEKIEVARK
jgi:hypothetical protein